MKGKWVVRGFGILLLIMIVVAGFGQAVLQLWNWLMPNIFGLHPITFWQAVGLMGLSWILFRGGFLGRPMGGGRWRHRMRERWEHMTPEQREQFREGMRSRCGPFSSRAADPKPEQNTRG
jgi:hypothetical protein